MARRGGLGRDLDSLLGAAKGPAVPVSSEPGTSDVAPTAEKSPKERSGGGSTAQQPVSQLEVAHSTEPALRNLPLDLLQRGQYQPRESFDQEALEELANSIRAQGVIQPIVARPIGTEGRYEIVAGERRWRAAQLAGLAAIPAVVREVDDQATMAMALIENLQRENLNPIEEASALQRLISEFGLTQQQAADAVGRSRTSVTNLLRLLNLNAEVGLMLERGKIEMGHARALLGLEGKTQIDAAKQVMLLGMSVRETEKLVRKLQQPKAETKSVAQELDPNVKRLQNDLSERLGATVTVQQGARGRGKLVIQYNSLDELDGILEHIH
jgi:ParB family chromosome partitioning protein